MYIFLLLLFLSEMQMFSIYQLLGIVLCCDRLSLFSALTWNDSNLGIF
jgi:hypothetical protein